MASSVACPRSPGRTGARLPTQRTHPLRLRRYRRRSRLPRIRRLLPHHPVFCSRGRTRRACPPAVQRPQSRLRTAAPGDPRGFLRPHCAAGCASARDRRSRLLRDRRSDSRVSGGGTQDDLPSLQPRRGPRTAACAGRAEECTEREWISNGQRTCGTESQHLLRSVRRRCSGCDGPPSAARSARRRHTAGREGSGSW